MFDQNATTNFNSDVDSSMFSYREDHTAIPQTNQYYAQARQ